MNNPDSISPFLQNNEAVFDQAWHAQVLAMADGLVQSGRFTPSEWAAALGAERSAATAKNAPDTADTYYHCALQALENLLAAAAEITPDDISTRSATWARAYLATPHGKPVLLSAGNSAD